MNLRPYVANYIRASTILGAAVFFADILSPRGAPSWALQAVIVFMVPAAICSVIGIWKFLEQWEAPN